VSTTATDAQTTWNGWCGHRTRPFIVAPTRRIYTLRNTHSRCRPATKETFAALETCTRLIAVRGHARDVWYGKQAMGRRLDVGLMISGRACHNRRAGPNRAGLNNVAIPPNYGARLRACRALRVRFDCPWLGVAAVLVKRVSVSDVTGALVQHAANSSHKVKRVTRTRTTARLPALHADSAG